MRETVPVSDGLRGLTVVVFTDLVESTALLARLGDDRMQLVQAAHVADVERAVGEHDGVVHKSMGDGVMASFSSALSALAAAGEVVRDLEALDAREGTLGLAVRVGVSAGEPIVNGSDIHGMAVVIAARLCPAAQPGEILVQDLVQRLVASRSGMAFGPSVAYELKGIPQPVQAAGLEWRSVTERAVPAPAVGAPPVRALPRVLAGFQGEPFVARDRESALLRRALLAPGAGRRAVLVLGEPGIGKTRHAAALAEEAHAGGTLVVLARCPRESVTPFEPWVRGLGELASAGDDAWRRRLARAAGAELCALLPELAGYAPASSSPPGAEGARFRVLRGIGDALGAALGDEGRLLLVLDDAHWCDEGSVQALRTVLDSPVGQRLSLLVTARDRELGRRHPVTQALNELRRTRELTELELDGLDASGISALLAARLGRTVAPRVVARLLARTGGNPFFTAELAHDLEDRNALRDDSALDRAPVPAAIAGLVEERLERLDSNTEAVLVAAAAIGPKADIALAGAAAGLAEDELAQAVSEAVAQRLVDELPAVRPTVVFPHALVREALLGLRTSAERARLHHAIAEQLAQRAATEPAELARHRELAAPVTGPGPAVAAHRLASDAAARAGAHDEAADYLDAALRLAGPQDPERAPMLVALGDQRLLAADLRRGRVAYRAAADASRATGDVMTLAHAALGDAGGVIGFVVEMPQEDPIGPALLREALDALGDRDPVLALGLSLRRAWALTYTEEAAELSALATNARRLAALAQTEEALYLARAVEVLGLATRSEAPLLNPGRAWEIAEQAVEHAERSGRDDLLLRALQMASYAAYVRADLTKVDALLARMDDLIARLDAPRYQSEVDFLRAGRHADHGELDAAERLLRRAGDALREVRSELQIATESFIILIDWVRTGDAARVHAAYTGIVAGTGLGVFYAQLVWMQALSGDQSGARSELRTLLADDFALLRHPDAHLALSLVVCAWAAEVCADREAAHALRPALERLRGTIAGGYPQLMFALPVAFGLGLLDLLDGDHDAAAREFEQALVEMEALENRLVTQWVALYLALALHRRARPGDREQAEALFESVSEQVQRLGLAMLQPELRRVRA
ncbi:MAG: hypothetical protein QOF76_403, partial [Solirubrobacteraceae bacterium]|nr:hypothetical protein [Solirubrobacteraceae bacterium]